MEDTVSALLGNVDRLLNDCDVLLAAKAYASAASLAILAFEECGKAYAIRFDLAPAESGIDPEKYCHAAALTGLCFATLRKYDIDERRLYEDMLPVLRAAPGSVDTAERLKALLQTTLEPIMRAQSSERNVQMGSDVKRLVELGKLVQAGTVGQLRGRGLKVETDAAHVVVSQPASVSRETAETWSWAADGVYHLLKRGTHHHPEVAEVAALIQALGQDRSEQRLAA